MQVRALPEHSNHFMVMADEKPRSIVETPTPEWAHMKPEEPEGSSANVRPAPGSATAPDNDGIYDDEVKDGKRVVVPKNRAEAIEDHFYNKNDKAGESKFDNMQDVIDYLYKAREAIHVPTKEELEKERRRKKTEGIISAIADGASAISNLISTTQYAPNMYQQENSMTGKMRERYDRLKKERDADADRYLNYSLMIGRLKDTQEAKEYQRGRDALQDQLAQLKAAHNARLSDIKYRRISQQIDDAQEAAEIRAADKELDRKIKEARVDEIKSRTRKNDRWQPSSGRGGGSQKGYAVYDKNGNVVGREPKQVDAAKRSIENGYDYPTQVTVSENKGGEKRTERSFNVEPNNGKKKTKNRLGL